MALKSNIKKQQKIFGILLLLLLSACTGLKENTEQKYTHHQTYDEFLMYLKKASDTIGDEYDKLSFIRKKVAELIDGGVGSKDASLLDANWPSWEGEKFYSVFYNNDATVKCGGSAHFLQKIYSDLGYNSDTYDMGCPGALTHQVTLVQNPENNKYYIQDAYFNSDFESDDGAELSFDELIALLGDNDVDEVSLNEESFDFIPDFDTTGLEAIVNTNNDAKKFVSPIKDQMAKGKNFSRFNIAEVGFEVRCVNSECFQQSQLPEELIYMYLLPLEHNSKKVLELYNKGLNNEP